MREPDEVHLAAPAGGAADELGAAAAQIKCAEQRPASPHFHHGIVRERDAHRVADTLFQKDAQATRAFDDALESGASLGDADVQRHLGQLGRQQAIGVDGSLHVVGLGRHGNVVEVALIFEEAHVFRGRGHQLLRQREILASCDGVIQRAGVHADADGDVRGGRGGDDLASGFQAADVARVDAQLGRPAGRRLDGNAGVEVNVGHHGQG